MAQRAAPSIRIAALCESPAGPAHKFRSGKDCRSSPRRSPHRSASDAFASNAAADMIWPAWQYPHCGTSIFAPGLCSGWEPSGESPSIVVMCAFAAAEPASCRAHGFPAKMHRACPALADAAAVFSAVQIEHVPEYPQKRSVWRHVDGGRAPVHSQLDSHSAILTINPTDRYGNHRNRDMGQSVPAPVLSGFVRKPTSRPALDIVMLHGPVRCFYTVTAQHWQDFS